ncbi:MAG: 6-O-methylguanine DNA methyltransferase [Euryarchaeota archaeon]|nr:6-O-methylguanine DNA methyltransferase [Euryarchaeota archaeon]
MQQCDGDRIGSEAEHPPFEGTAFQVKVWNAMKEIPRGETRTYTQIAVQIGHPNSARAVANACGQNPYPPIVPCHRVVRSDGSLGGYSGEGGVETKRRLLREEGVEFSTPS